MTTLLCLLSDQPIPNLLSIHHFQADDLVLVETKRMKGKEAAQKLLTALKLGGRDYEARYKIVALEEEDQLGSITTALQAAYRARQSDEWIVNLSGGTKPMAIGAYETFKEEDVRLIYINVASPEEMINFRSFEREACGYRPKIEEFLAAYGFKLNKSTKKQKAAEERAEKWWDCARIIAEQGEGEEILTLSHKERADARKKGMELQGQFRETNETIREAVRKTFGLDRKMNGNLNKYEARFLTGEFLEVFLWGLLNRHAEKLGIWDVRQGVPICPQGRENENELDVSFMHNHTLCMVECKSGKQDQDKEFDILYKVEAIIRQFRALRVRSWLATTADHHKFENTGEVKPHIKTRAEIYNCRIIDREEIQVLARNPDDVDRLRTTLFSNCANA